MIRSNDEDDYQYIDQVTRTEQFAATASSKDLIEPLVAVVNELKNKFGNWNIPWGTINRFQRISGDIDQQWPRPFSLKTPSRASGISTRR